MDIFGEDAPDHLRDAGPLRLEHKQASLEELGALADPPMTKDAFVGRIRQLLAMADKRAAARAIEHGGGPDAGVAVGGLAPSSAAGGNLPARADSSLFLL